MRDSIEMSEGKLSLIITDKVDFARGVPGYYELVVGLIAKYGCCPSRDGALGVIG
jgi:hypothetical protein